MVLKFKVVLKGYRQPSKIFGYGSRKVSKLLSYKVRCKVALGVSQVSVGQDKSGVRLKRRVKGVRGLVFFNDGYDFERVLVNVKQIYVLEFVCN